MLKHYRQIFLGTEGNLSQLGQVVRTYQDRLIRGGYVSRMGCAVTGTIARGLLAAEGVLCDPSALADAAQDEPIERLLSEMESLLQDRPVTELSEYLPGADDSYCGHTAWGTLMICCDPLIAMSPIVCGTCGGRVASYKLPLSAEGREVLWRWDIQYTSLYTCWIHGSEYEQWAGDQLEDVKSDINSMGLELANTLKGETGSEVMYYLHGSRNLEATDCPRCGGQLGENPRAIWRACCDRCGLVMGLE